MKVFRSVRLFVLALLLSVVPASSFAGVFISVGFAPPVLPVYEQPPCPMDGYLWTPGYWAYGDYGYYWIPGAWVPAPQPGYLWTPPYWGFEGGAYLFHAGYWGPHVGYYGGVNYGFGYMGIGFIGGEWRGGRFAYNTAVVRVNTTIIHNTYIDRNVIRDHTVVNDRRVSFSGGPGGIRHDPTADERRFSSERRMGPTAVQNNHFQAAARDPQQRFNTNRGRPGNVATARPMAPAGNRPEMNNRPDNRPGMQSRPENNNRPSPGMQARPENNNRPAVQARPENNSRPAMQQTRPESRPESRPMQQARPESRPAPAARPESRPASHPAPHGGEHGHGR